MFPNNNSASGWVGAVGSVREVQGLEIMNREGNTFRSKVSLNANHTYPSTKTNMVLVTYNQMIFRWRKSSE